jgi:hypothetical protein
MQSGKGRSWDLYTVGCIVPLEVFFLLPYELCPEVLVPLDLLVDKIRE